MSIHTTIPVPKVLAWSEDSHNPVGTGYLITQKAPGFQLGKVLTKMTWRERLSLMGNMTKIEGQLTTTVFPAYGSLYFRRSIPKNSNWLLLNTSTDPTGSFCVGPLCASSIGTYAAHIPDELDVGPCKYSISFRYSV